MQISLQCFQEWGADGYSLPSTRCSQSPSLPSLSHHPHPPHGIPFPRSQEFWILGKRRKRLGLWTPGSQESPAGQRGRGGAGMQRVGSHLRHLIPLRPAAVLLAASPSAPQSQPRGSIEGTGRGKGILSQKPVEKVAQAPLRSLLTGSALTHTDAPLSPKEQRESPEDRHAPLAVHRHLPLPTGWTTRAGRFALPGTQHPAPLTAFSLSCPPVTSVKRTPRWLQGSRCPALRPGPLIAKAPAGLRSCPPRPPPHSLSRGHSAPA